MRLPQDLVPYLSTMPQPIALALGRVVRSTGRPERLEACLKAAEVLTRYVAVASLASAASTRAAGQDLPAVEGFEGNLAFGTFELAIREALGVAWEHPLREQLRAAMRSTKKHTAVAGVQLERFVELRNDLGHAITHVDEARASNLFEEHDPIGGLIECLDDLGIVLSSPPLVVLRQEHRGGRLTAQFLFFVGEGEPIPHEIDLGDPVVDWEKPYLCTPAGLLPLTPGLVLLTRPDGRRGLYLIDGVDAKALRYKGTFDNDVLKVSGAQEALGRWLAGVGTESSTVADASPLIEPVTCADGRGLNAFLRNEPPPAGTSDAIPAVAVAPPEQKPAWTLSSFERALNNVGLGTAYRDVVYAMAERGCRPEPTSQGVRLVGGPDGARTLVLIELRTGPVLTVTIQLEAFPAGQEGTETVALAPAETADELVTRLADLLDQQYT